MKEEIIEFFKNEYNDYECKCPKCGHTMITNSDFDNDICKDIDKGEIIDMYCVYCDTEFKAKLK